MKLSKKYRQIFHPISPGKPQARLPGVFFFWFFSFGQAKEKNNKLKIARHFKVACSVLTLFFDSIDKGNMFILDNNDSPLNLRDDAVTVNVRN
ncbi:MAG: hypothetical protein B5M56_07965 [Desulfococcus sp. 4484_241]|nr:MAG: hypothetical protein B5M56_07965 [Desulfococcus sp. 4484_241]